MNKTISMKQLQAVEAVARLGSFTEAARELGVSQPSISNLIYALEKQYKCRFFERNGATILSTDMLEGVRGQIKAIIALKDEVEQHLEAGRDLKAGSLQIGYTTYQLSMPVISTFVHRFPGVDVTARTMATDDLLPLLASGELDVGFITEPRVPDGMEWLKIAQSDIGLVLPQNHPLAAKGRVKWADLAGLDLIQREPSSGTRRTFEAAAAAVGTDICTKMALGSWGSIMAVVRAGVGVGVGFEREFEDEQGLAFLPIDEDGLQISHFLVCLTAMRQTSTVDQFFEVAAAGLGS